jgi:hypothetical protein
MKDLSLHILDIVQNSISAGARLIEILIIEDKAKDLYTLIIKDDGKGMDEEMLTQVTDPFFTTRTTRKVGLGIPLLKLNAERTGGSFSIDSSTGKGTILTATFKLSHIDRLPDGDIPGTIVLLSASNPTLEFIYTHKTPAGEYTFDTREIKEVLGDIKINDLAIYPYLKELIAGNLRELKQQQT